MNQNFNSPGNPAYIPSQSTYPPISDFPNMPMSPNISPNSPANPQYAESIFRQNLGRRVSVYFSYPDSVQWRDRIFTGTILDEGRDFLLLEDDDGKTTLLWLVYINFAIFDETPNY